MYTICKIRDGIDYLSSCDGFLHAPIYSCIELTRNSEMRFTLVIIVPV